MAKFIQRALAALFVAIALMSSPQVLAQTQQQLSWCLHKDDTFSPALRIDGCTAAIKSGHQSGKNLSRIFYNRGIAYAKKNQYDRAIEDFNQAIRLDPDSIFALNNRGAAYARKGQLDDAIADFNEAIRIDASYAITYNNRGIAYAKKGQYDRAIEDFDQAIRYDPKDTSAFKNRDLTKQLMGGAAANTEVASAPKTRALTEQMKELPPNAGTIEASAPKHGIPVEPANPRSSVTGTNDAGAFPKRSEPTQLDGIGTDTDQKIAPSQKPRKPVIAAAKIKSKVHRSKDHIASARPHKSRPQSALVRFFKKNPLIPNFQKFLKLASRKSNANARNSY